jgi:hypothetical protein
MCLNLTAAVANSRFSGSIKAMFMRDTGIYFTDKSP